MTKTTLKTIKNLVKNNIAIDITTLKNEEYKKIEVEEKLYVSIGVYGKMEVDFYDKNI